MNTYRTYLPKELSVYKGAVEVEIEYEISPYDPGGPHSPPYGGAVNLGRAWLVDAVGNHGAKINLSHRKCYYWAAWLAKEILKSLAWEAEQRR